MTDTPPKPPTTDNVTAGKWKKAMAALGNGGVAAVEALILADVPWLGYPVVKQLWEAAFGWIASYFIVAAEGGIVFTVIDTQVDQEEFYISEQLAHIMLAEKTGDPDAIKAAIQAYANAQSALVRNDGSTPIH